jgi:hypothetical protein
MNDGSMMPEILLVGTVHRDPEGYGKLLSILDEEDPDLLTLEMSPYAVWFRREKRVALRRRLSHILEELAREAPPRPYRDPFSHSAIRNILAIIEFPYEYEAASTFSRSRDIPFHCIDRSDYSRERISRIERELITKKNLRMLIRLGPDDVCRRISQEYFLASMAIDGDLGSTYCIQDRRELSMRDRFMARRIRGLLDVWRCRKLVHIGGWKHLLNHKKKRDTLYASF